MIKNKINISPGGRCVLERFAGTCRTTLIKKALPPHLAETGSLGCASEINLFGVIDQQGQVYKEGLFLYNVTLTVHSIRMSKNYASFITLWIFYKQKNRMPAKSVLNKTNQIKYCMYVRHSTSRTCKLLRQMNKTKQQKYIWENSIIFPEENNLNIRINIHIITPRVHQSIKETKIITRIFCILRITYELHDLAGQGARFTRLGGSRGKICCYHFPESDWQKKKKKNIRAQTTVIII